MSVNVHMFNDFVPKIIHAGNVSCLFEKNSTRNEYVSYEMRAQVGSCLGVFVSPWYTHNRRSHNDTGGKEISRCFHGVKVIAIIELFGDENSQKDRTNCQHK